LRHCFFNHQSWQARNFLQHFERKLAANCGRDLSDLAQTTDAVEPCHERIVQRSRDACARKFTFQHVSALAIKGEPALENRSGQLLDKERHPVGTL